MRHFSRMSTYETFDSIQIDEAAAQARDSDITHNYRTLNNSMLRDVALVIYFNS